MSIYISILLIIDIGIIFYMVDIGYCDSLFRVP